MDWTLQLHLAGCLALAAGLGALIGVERHFRNKNSGLRTHALVALGAAGFVVVSKYGFLDHEGANPADPTRVAAQIVSGIGFLGAGVIFVRRDAVRGLTTASTIWLTAAVGMAAGASMPITALTLTAMNFFVLLLLPRVAEVLPRSRSSINTITIAYPDHQGMLRQILAALTSAGWKVANFEEDRRVGEEDTMVTVRLDVSGTGNADELASRLSIFGPRLSMRLGSTDD